MDEGYIVRLRGLPWSVGKEEVANFLSGCDVADVHFTFTRDGRPSGEAYVEMNTESDVQEALARNQQHMGKRYIEVFRSKRSEMDYVIQKDGAGGSHNMMGNTDNVVRLRGLPFSCTNDDISNFFKGMQIVQNGIALLADELGRASGEAYVQFSSQQYAELALQKHKEKMGTRYVEIFKSSMLEAETAISTYGKFVPGASGGRGGGMRPSPYDRMSRGGGGMRGMRGMSRGMRGGNIKGIMGHMDSGYGAYGDMGLGGYGGGSGYGAYGSRSGRGMRGGGGGMGGGGMGNGRGGGMEEYESSTGHSVHMRGLPYSAGEADVYQFFSPLNPVMVTIGYNHEGRPSGEADVDFATHADAQIAMKKHKAMMERRYIELFLNSVPDVGGGYSSFQDADGYGDSMLYGAQF